jgi:hypothetical protein
MLLLVF